MIVRTGIRKPKSSRNSTLPAARSSPLFAGPSLASFPLHQQQKKQNNGPSSGAGRNFNFANIPVLSPTATAIHPKLTIGRRNDKYEQEAERMADTVGQDVIFGANQYAPTTGKGHKLPTHELTHVVEQNKGSRATRGQRKEKGTDKDNEAKIKRKSSIDFSVVRSHQLPPEAGDVKRACPAAAPAGQRHRRLNSTAAQIGAMGACTWGITAPDDLGITTRTCKDGANWRLIVTRVNSVIRLHSRLLPGQAEPIPGKNTTAANFCNQVTELDTLGACPGAWYMIRAVRAHENVHVNEWRNNFTADWNPLEAAVEALTVPAVGATANRATATATLRGMAAFQNARNTSNAGGNFPVFWGIPDPNANTDAAERAVVNPRIRWICKHAKWRGFGAAGCPVCATLGIV